MTESMTVTNDITMTVTLSVTVDRSKTNTA